MNAPNEIPVPRTEEAPRDLAAAVGQLRTLVCGLGAGLLLVSLVFSAFVYKQNRNLSSAAGNRRKQIQQLEASQQGLVYLVNELAKYSLGKPELTALFTKRGIEIAPTAAPVSPSN